MAVKCLVRVQTFLDNKQYIVEKITTKAALSKLYHPQFVDELIDVTNLIPQPDVWWLYENGEFYSPN